MVSALNLHQRYLFPPSKSDSLNIDEYTKEFEKLRIKCDTSEPEEQTIARYLGGHESKYVNLVELQ